MKKSLYILGVITILTLLGILGYLFFASPSSDTGSFADLNLEDTTENIVVPPDTTEAPPEQTGERDPLIQLTTRPVVGYQMVVGTSSRKVLFVEAGTGHIFDLDLSSLVERRVSNLTVVNVTEAVIDSTGKFAVLLSDDIHVIDLEAPIEERTSVVIEENAEAIQIIDDTLVYQVPSPTGTQVKTFSLTRMAETGTLFEIPFREVTIGWGQSLEGPHIYYPKPATQLEGYIYVYNNGATSRLPLRGFGATATLYGDDVIFLSGGNESTIEIYNLTSGIFSSTRVETSPHKCVKMNISDFLCAEPETYSANIANERRLGSSYTSDKYRIIFTDSKSTSVPLSFSQSEITLDVEKPIFQANTLLFTNKRDGFLWAYSIS